MDRDVHRGKQRNIVRSRRWKLDTLVSDILDGSDDWTREQGEHLTLDYIKRKPASSCRHNSHCIQRQVGKSQMDGGDLTGTNGRELLRFLWPRIH